MSAAANRTTVRTITIFQHEDNHFDVVTVAGIASGLCYDEMLGEIARLGALAAPRYIHTADQIVDAMERRARRRSEKEGRA